MLLGMLHGKSDAELLATGKENEGAMLLKLLHAGGPKAPAPAKAETKPEEPESNGTKMWENSWNSKDWGADKKWQGWENTSTDKHWDSHVKTWKTWDNDSAGNSANGDINKNGRHSAWQTKASDKPRSTAGGDGASTRRREEGPGAAAAAPAGALDQQARAAIRQAAAAARRSSGAVAGGRGGGRSA
mmetsp:Transcript_88991/g.251149  ORF Transcript_88991/g.251149 Transcript_88991/m.251149 type:complete len:187 (-) Transcript_88991:132-692(-)